MPSLKAQTEPAACFQRKSTAVGEGIGVTKLSDINCVGRSEMEEEIRWKRRLHESLALREGLNISTITSQMGKERQGESPGHPEHSLTWRQVWLSWNRHEICRQPVNFPRVSPPLQPQPLGSVQSRFLRLTWAPSGHGIDNHTCQTRENLLTV